MDSDPSTFTYPDTCACPCLRQATQRSKGLLIATMGFTPSSGRMVVTASYEDTMTLLSPDLNQACKINIRCGDSDHTRDEVMDHRRIKPMQYTGDPPWRHMTPLLQTAAANGHVGPWHLPIVDIHYFLLRCMVWRGITANHD
jgi:hypothetical protein